MISKLLTKCSLLEIAYITRGTTQNLNTRNPSTKMIWRNSANISNDTQVIPSWLQKRIGFYCVTILGDVDEKVEQRWRKIILPCKLERRANASSVIKLSAQKTTRAETSKENKITARMKLTVQLSKFSSSLYPNLIRSTIDFSSILSTRSLCQIMYGSPKSQLGRIHWEIWCSVFHKKSDCQKSTHVTA